MLTHDAEAIFRDYDVPFQVTGKQDQEMILRCPYCAKPKLYVNRDSGVYNCYHCSDLRGYHVGYLLVPLLGLSRTEALRVAKKYLRAGSDLEVRKPREVVRIDLPKGCYPLDDPEDATQSLYFAYLAARRVSRAAVRQYRMHYSVKADLRGRVIVPVIQDGKLVSYVARDVIGRNRPKVVTPDGNAQGRTLFNLDVARHAKTVLITEGVFDALRLPDRSVATFGKRISSAQAHALFTAGVRELVWCWDSDALVAAHEAAWAHVLQFDRVRVAHLPPGRDPSDLTGEELLARVEQSLPVNPLAALEYAPAYTFRRLPR